MHAAIEIAVFEFTSLLPYNVNIGPISWCVVNETNFTCNRGNTSNYRTWGARFFMLCAL